MWQLIINGPGYFDTTYQLPEGATALGRAEENDIVLSGDLVSRRHARLRLEGGKLTIEDSKSRNGSKVNGEAITGPVELKVGDVLTVGENSLAVRFGAAVDVAATDLLESGSTPVRRVSGDLLGGAVLVARNIRESVVLRALDNVAPLPMAPFDTDDGAPAANGNTVLSYEALALLYKTAERMVHAPSLQSFLEETVDRLIERATATTGVLLLRNSTGALVPSIVRHQKPLATDEVPVSDAILAEALRTGSALVVSNAIRDERFSDRESVRAYAPEQVICVPIGASAPYRGVLYLSTRSQSTGFLETLVDLCTALGHLIAGSIDAFGQYSRPTGEERLRRVLERAHPPETLERRIAAIRGGSPAVGLVESRVSMLSVELLPPEGPSPSFGALIDAFHQRAVGIIFSFDGSIESIRGTAVRAVFGAPFERRDDSHRAVRAALALEAEWKKLREALAVTASIRMAITTGPALSGVVGGVRHDFVVAGDAPMWAETLLRGTPPDETYLDHSTLVATDARFEVDPAGEQTLAPGKASEQVYRLLPEDVASFTMSGVTRLG